MDAPCKFCTLRHENCHAVCELYKEFQEERRTYNEARYQQYENTYWKPQKKYKPRRTITPYMEE